MIRRYGRDGLMNTREELEMWSAGSVKKYRAKQRENRIRDRASKDLLKSLTYTMPRDLAAALKRTSRARQSGEAMLGLKLLYEIAPKEVLSYLASDEEVMTKIGQGFYRYIHSSTKNPDTTLFRGVHFAAMHRPAIINYLNQAFAALQSFRGMKPVTVYVTVGTAYVADAVSGGMMSPAFIKGTKERGKAWRMGWGRYVSLDPATSASEITGRGGDMSGFKVLQLEYCPKGGLFGTYDIFPSVRNPVGGANIVEYDAGAGAQFGPVSAVGGGVP